MSEAIISGNDGVITTGGCTVEHPATLSVEDSQSYGTNIEFLNIVNSARNHSQY